MRSGCSVPASVTPASASVALSAVCPAFSSRNVASVMFAGLSSTTRTFAMSDHRGPPRYGAPDFTRELPTVEAALLQNRGYQTVQLDAIFGGNRFRSDNQDGNVCRARLFLKRGYLIKTVNFRTLQI